MTAFGSVAPAQVLSYSTIALSNTPAPGLSLVNFDTLSDPRINDSGKVLFWSRLVNATGGTSITVNNDVAVWSDRAGGAGAMSLIVRKGQGFDGQTTLTIGGIPTVGFTPQGRYAFSGVITDSTAPNQQTRGAFFVEDLTGNPHMVASEAVNTPALPGIIPVNRNSGIAGSELRTLLPANGFLYRNAAAPISAGIAAPGAGGPGLPANAVLRRFTQPSLNNFNQIVFRAEAGSPNIETNAKLGLFSDRSGTLDQVALIGNAVPDFTSHTWKDLALEPVLNDLGTVAFWADTNLAAGGSGGQVIVRNTLTPAGPGPFQRLAAFGELISPGSTITFNTFARRVALSPRDRVAFLAYLGGAATSDNNAAIFVDDPMFGSGGGRTLIAQRGQPAPGVGSGVFFNVFSEPRLSRAGRIAFLAQLKGASVPGTATQALFASTRAGTLRKIVRAGDVFIIPGSSPSVSKTIRAIVFDHDSADSGHSQFTAGGTLVFKLTFTDNTQGLFSANIDCLADLDDGSGSGTPDGGVTLDDLLYFLAQYELGAPAADFDDGSATGTPDGGVTIEDLLFFLARFDAGC